MWEWMKSVREGQKPVASFYFPDILAGPDILFSLEPKEPSSSGPILCVLQVSFESSAEAGGLRLY